MSSTLKAIILAAAAGALTYGGTAEPGAEPLHAEVRRDITPAEAKPVPQLRCRMYFGCAPIAHGTAEATQP